MENYGCDKRTLWFLSFDVLINQVKHLLSEPVVNDSNVECQPKVWSDAPIIEEYESDSDDELDVLRHDWETKAPTLLEFQEFNGGPVTFGGSSKGYITRFQEIIEDESWVDAMQEELLQFEITESLRQEERIDYDEVFALVAKLEAIRIFLAFASYMGFIVYQIDMKSAFLYGKIDEEVYVSQPPDSDYLLEQNLDRKSQRRLSISWQEDSFLSNAKRDHLWLYFYDMREKMLLLQACCGASYCGSESNVSYGHLDAKKKFVMYPRFISIFLGKQLDNVSVPLDHFPVNTLTSKVFSFMVKKGKHFSGKVTPLFATLLVQPTQDEGASSERPSKAQPTPSPAPTSEVPHEPQSDSSPAHTSEEPLEHQTDQSPRPSPTTTIPDSIPCLIEAKIPKEEISKKNIRVHKESVSKQGRKFAKGESSVQRDPLFDEIPEDTVDHMETKNAQMERRTREIVDEDKEIDENILSTEDVLSNDKEEV
ncbi:putative ribonuclease H-like domain-containing protein [Tanacetum coccineum]|uniref:Ribonuclease H-like domain-containing protein n=1 Tax=Tanacetum coccineum TaxID=301880 RepID=A0ABQ5IW60_9ASTR